MRHSQFGIIGSAHAGAVPTTAAATSQPPRRREVRRYYPSYSSWIRTEAGVIAPKVRVIGFLEPEEGGSGLGLGVGVGVGGPGAGSAASTTAVMAPSFQAPSQEWSGLTMAHHHHHRGSGSSNNKGADDDANGEGDGLGHIRYGGSRQHRGLYATSRIEPGELIMRVPAGTLLGCDSLRERGGQYLEEGPLEEEELREEEMGVGGVALGHDKDECDELKVRRRRIRMERCLIATIESLRRFSEAAAPDDAGGNNDDETAKSNGDSSKGKGEQGKALGCRYEWKDDDGLALFLIGARIILHSVPLHAPLPSSSVAASDHGDVVGKDGVECQSSSSLTPSLLPHVSILPTGYVTNRLYFTPEELDRMGGEIRTDSVRPRKTDVLGGVESDWRSLKNALRELYGDNSGRPVALSEDWVCGECRRSSGGSNDETKGGTGTGSDGSGKCNSDGRGGERHRCCFYLDPDTGLTLDAYKWALSMVYSRSCDFVVSTGTTGTTTTSGTGNATNNNVVRRVIAPLLDIANHDFASPLRHRMDSQGNISLYNGFEGDDAPALEEGSEITLNFKAFPNAELLLHYRRFFFIGAS